MKKKRPFLNQHPILRFPEREFSLEMTDHQSLEDFLSLASVMIVDDQFVGRKVLEGIIRSRGL